MGDGCGWHALRRVLVGHLRYYRGSLVGVGLSLIGACIRGSAPVFPFGNRIEDYEAHFERTDLKEDQVGVLNEFF